MLKMNPTEQSQLEILMRSWRLPRAKHETDQAAVVSAESRLRRWHRPDKPYRSASIIGYVHKAMERER